MGCRHSLFFLFFSLRRQTVWNEKREISILLTRNAYDKQDLFPTQVSFTGKTSTTRTDERSWNCIVQPKLWTWIPWYSCRHVILVTFWHEPDPIRSRASARSDFRRFIQERGAWEESWQRTKVSNIGTTKTTMFAERCQQWSKGPTVMLARSRRMREGLLQLKFKQRIYYLQNVPEHNTA